MRFLLTKELGRLAKWLRILGYDAEYFKGDNPGSLLVLALRDSRVILTRNRRLSSTITSVKIVVVGSEQVKQQLREVLKRFNLSPNPVIMFSRCLLCNVALQEANKEELKGRVAEYVFNTQERFTACPKCGRIYWQGTHWGNASQIIGEILR